MSQGCGVLLVVVVLEGGCMGLSRSREGGKSWERATGGVGEDSVVMVPAGETRRRIRRGSGSEPGLELVLELEEVFVMAVVVASWTICVRPCVRVLRPLSEERMLQAWGQLKCWAAARRRSLWWPSM